MGQALGSGTTQASNGGTGGSSRGSTIGGVNINLRGKDTEKTNYTSIALIGAGVIVAFLLFKKK